MRKLLPVLALLPALALAADAPKKREVGALVIDGIPEIPPAVAERTNQYQNTRSAAFQDFDPRPGGGVLIATRFGQSAQIHQVAKPGAARRQLTFFPEPVTAAGYDPARPGEGFWFRMDVGGGEFYQYYWYDLNRGETTLVTDGKSRNEGLLPARGGGKFALVSTRRNGTDFDVYVGSELVKEVKGQWMPLDWSDDDQRLLLLHEISINESYLHVLDLATKELTEVNPRPVSDKPAEPVAYAAAAFAPGGGAVLYASDEGSEFHRLTRYDLKTQKKEILTPDLSWDVEGITVSHDGKWLAYTANEGGASALYLGAAAAPRKAKRVALPKGVIGGFGFDRQGKRLGLTLTQAQAPADVYTVDVKSRKLTRWTESEVGGLDPTTFVAPELVEYPTFDGKKIPAWVYKPRVKKAVPVIIDIHGGPEGQARAWFGPMTQYFVNELGVAVIQPNVRGSSGYGKGWLLLDNGMKREDSVKDIGALLDWIATQPDLDAKRVAVYGGSYGGYMVLASMVHYGDRLRCGVDIVGISNFVTFLTNTQDYRRDLRRAEYGDERDPAMKKHLEAISPTTNAKKINKPLFVAQGANDPRVPLSEADQIVSTVRRNGVPVWYLVARDEGHGFQKKSNRDYYSNALALFFKEYLVK